MNDTHTNTELAVERLREAILNGDLRPGEKLHQDELAHRLGISRTPLRTALTSLAETGLVVYESNRGFFVREFSITEVTGAFQVRAELEAMACRLAAANMTEAAHRTLCDLVTEGDRLLAPGDLVPDNLIPYRRMNVAFHTLIVTLSNNPWIDGFVRSLHTVPGASDRVILWRDFQVILRSHDDHRRIAQALSKGQGERAAAIMREHVTFSLEYLIQQLKLYPQDFLHMPCVNAPAKGKKRTGNRRRSV